MPRKGQTIPNRFNGDGAKGACFFEIEEGETKDKGGDPMARVTVGWSCVIVTQQEVPVSWLAEVMAIVTSHKDGIAGFLKEQRYGGDGRQDDHDSYALMCDPPK